MQFSDKKMRSRRKNRGARENKCSAAMAAVVVVVAGVLLTTSVEQAAESWMRTGV